MKNSLKSSLLTLTIAATVFAGANPAAAAQTLTLPHTAQPGIVPVGAKNQLNTQPIPPGHVLTIMNSLVTSALNTQPIPPGHVTNLSRSNSVDALGAGKGGHGRGKKSVKPHTGWDLSKNQKV